MLNQIYIYICKYANLFKCVILSSALQYLINIYKFKTAINDHVTLFDASDISNSIIIIIIIT